MITLAAEKEGGGGLIGGCTNNMEAHKGVSQGQRSTA
jgi:hypothetical protein